MKTSAKTSDPSLKEARRLADRESTTLRKVGFKGKGLQPALKTATWDKLRELAYEGRGA